MNEPKRRGRRPKSLDEKVTEAMDKIPREDTPLIRFMKERSLAQAYANRVWSGQSTDVPLKERIARVHAALNGQGLPTDVQLPPNG